MPASGGAGDAPPAWPTPSAQEFACFSYDENRHFYLGDRSLKWYYPPRLGADLSRGFDAFQKHDDSRDEHLDGLLKTIAAHEQETRQPIDAHVVTWRGIMTKVRRPAAARRAAASLLTPRTRPRPRPRPCRSWRRHSSKTTGNASRSRALPPRAGLPLTACSVVALSSMPRCTRYGPPPPARPRPLLTPRQDCM